MSEQITDERLKRIFECCSGKSHFAVGEFVKINEGALMAQELINFRANAKTAQEKMVLDYVRRAIACGENISKSFIMDPLAEKPIQKPEKMEA